MSITIPDPSQCVWEWLQLFFDASGFAAEHMLVQASMKGKTSQMRIMLDHGIDKDWCDETEEGQGHTPLTAALQHGQVAAATLLLTSGANVCKPNRDGLLPIYFVCDWKDGSDSLFWQGQINQTYDEHLAYVSDAKLDLLQLLVSYGADVNDLGLSMSTPLREAVMSGAIKMSRYLLSLGALDLSDPRNQNILHEAIEVRMTSAYHAKSERDDTGTLQLVTMLLNAGAVIDHPRTSPCLKVGETPLFTAISLLVDPGRWTSSSNSSDDSYDPEEDYHEQLMKVVRELLTRGADVQYVNSHKRFVNPTDLSTPMMKLTLGYNSHPPNPGWNREDAMERLFKIVHTVSSK